MFVTLKFRERKSDGGINGSRRIVIRNGSATVATNPIASVANPNGSRHSRCWL